MNMSWVDRLKFQSNPYQKLDPFKIDPSRLAWNRDDLEEEKEKVDDFVDDLASGSRGGMRAIGGFGSGKTWLARIIQIQLKEKLKGKTFSIYTKVPKIEPTFSNVYSIAIKDFLAQFDTIKEIVMKEKGATDLGAWSSVFEDEDLAKGVNHICSGGKPGLIARRWITGNRVTATELGTLDIVDPITGDYKRFETLVETFKDLSRIFSSSLLIVDELENAPLKLANALSDGLRDMLSIFDENFGLICLFTAQSFDEWYDAGYTEALTRRMDYHLQISEISQSAIHKLLRVHQKLYRKKRARIGGEQLYPFTIEAIDKIFELTPLGRKYPGFIFPNLEAIAKSALRKGERLPISSDFVVDNISVLPYGTMDVI